MKAYDKAEDPIYALEHNLPIDFQHYLDHHLELPLTRLFGPVMNNPKELMTGTVPVNPKAGQRVMPAATIPSCPACYKHARNSCSPFELYDRSRMGCGILALLSSLQ